MEQITDPMDSNYKFSRKFELGVLQEEVVDKVNKNFVAKKIALPPDGDMKKIENQARIEVWSPTNRMVGRISIDSEATLNKSPFLGFLTSRIAKSEKLVKDEIARIEKAQKDREEKAKKEQETAKQE